MEMAYLYRCNKDGDIKESGQKVKYTVEETASGMTELYMTACG